MGKLFLAEPSEKYKNSFIQMVQDYEMHGEKEYFDMYKGAAEDFHAYVEKIGLPQGWVPCSAYWLVNSEAEIFGGIRIRKELNSEFLKNIAGHIGYDISPSHRGKGYGKFILKLGLEKAKIMNISPVLLTCKSDNYASAKVIESNNGIFESEIFDGLSKQFYKRYWINI